MAEAGPGRGHSTWPLQSYTLIMARPGAGAGQGAEQGAGLVNRGFEGDGANVAFSPPAAAPPPEDAGAELADCSLLGLRLRPLNILRGPRCCTVLYCTALYCTVLYCSAGPGAAWSSSPPRPSCRGSASTGWPTWSSPPSSGGQHWLGLGRSCAN